MKSKKKSEPRGLNMRDLAKEVSKREGGHVNLSIAQIAEVLRHTMIILATKDEKKVLNTIDRYRFV